MIALLVMTDGRRDCISRTIPSALVELQPSAMISEHWIHDDSGDPAYRAWLHETYPESLGWRIFGPEAGRSGFGGAIRSAWDHLRKHSEARYIFHLEDDFLFLRRVNVVAMAAALDAHPWLVQMALRRQPWNAEEAAAGGVVEQHPGDYMECGAMLGDNYFAWLEHRRFFTTNPSLYRRTLIDDYDWPIGGNSEGRFSIDLFAADPGFVSAFWGERDSGEAVHHIGVARVGSGY